MAFKFSGAYDISGGEVWYDPVTGDRQIRNVPPPEITTEKSQATPPADPTKATISQSELNSIVEDTPTFTPSQLNKDLTAGTAPAKPGNTTNDDASINNTKSGTNATINASTDPGNPIRPSPNALDQFASYTYSLSLYLITPEQYKALGNAKINTNQWSLLMQSGGAAQPLTTAAPPAPKPAPPATQTRPVTASYNPDGTVNATDANAFGAG